MGMEPSSSKKMKKKKSFGILSSAASIHSGATDASGDETKRLKRRNPGDGYVNVLLVLPLSIQATCHHYRLTIYHQDRSPTLKRPRTQTINKDRLCNVVIVHLLKIIIQHMILHL